MVLIKIVVTNSGSEVDVSGFQRLSRIPQMLSSCDDFKGIFGS